ncbi:MAG: hypothetical protein J6Y74_02985 [Clostridia bacterium]|nr:hypothetical protein [Clostridia bacterium]
MNKLGREWKLFIIVAAAMAAVFLAFLLFAVLSFLHSGTIPVFCFRTGVALSAFYLVSAVALFVLAFRRKTS